MICPTSRPSNAVSSASAAWPAGRPCRASAARSKRTRTVGMSACGSSARSTRPGMSCIAVTTWFPSARSTPRSFPKILTATLARDPDSMWSIRCEIGWPTVMLVPGISDRRPRISCSTTSRGRPSGSSRTSISADSTPWTCSSSSARPVRRAVATTSGTSSRRRSIALPSAFDSARLVPGSVTALMTRAPSLKAGRKARPISGIVASAPMSRKPAAPSPATGDGARAATGADSPVSTRSPAPARAPRGCSVRPGADTRTAPVSP